MAATMNTSCSFPGSLAVCPLREFRGPANFLKLDCSWKRKPAPRISAWSGSKDFRSRISRLTAVAPKPSHKVLTVCSSANGNSEDSGLEQSASDSGITIDLKLPRRSMLVEFTCNECGERTKRLINRLAYEKGLIFVQCAGCLRHHKLVDNLGLIVEYDFRDEKVADLDTDQPA